MVVVEVVVGGIIYYVNAASSQLRTHSTAKPSLKTHHVASLFSLFECRDVCNCVFDGLSLGN